VEAVTVVALVALIWKLVDVMKYMSASDWIAVRTQVIVWVAAIAVVALASQADLSEQLTLVGDRPLGSLNVWSIVLAGFLLGSTTSATVDVKKAIDGKDTAVKPPLAFGPTRR